MTTAKKKERGQLFEFFKVITVFADRFLTNAFSEVTCRKMLITVYFARYYILENFHFEDVFK